MKSSVKLYIKLAWMQTLSLWRAGALNVLVFALVLAVAAITAVGFFTQRVESALNQQGGMLLGGDLSIQSDHPVPAQYKSAASAAKLSSVSTYEFPSMVVNGETNQLAEIKAVESGFPMRGDLTIGSTISETGNVVKSIPKSGEVWIEPRLATLLNLKVGDVVNLGERSFTISAILLREPSRGGDMFGFAPRVMMNASDLDSTKLIQYGSRVKYQLLLAGDVLDIQRFYEETQAKLGRGEKIQDVRNARPEIKSALDKAQQFLGLSAMISVVLAMAAMLLASLPYIKQSLDTFALMRCFGASQNTVLQVLTIQTLLIAALSALVGVILGFFAQLGLAQLASSLFLESLPNTSFLPIISGLVASIAMMAAVVLPHMWQMRTLTAINILRRETLIQPLSALARFLPAVLVLSIMVFWQANNIKIAVSTIMALIAICILITGLAYVMTMLIAKLFALTPQNPQLNAIKLGVQGIKRRFGLSTVQMIGFSMGLMVLMLLALIRSDLIRNWQASLPADAPNRFIINIQPEQVSGVSQFFKEAGIANNTVFPMVRGRLVSKNEQAISAMQWEDERAKRLAEREFNLSWAANMQTDNKLLAGKWWTEADHGKPYLSLEQDLAKTLNIKLGDQLVFDIAGQSLKLTVTSIRKVEWDTMRANFFAVTPPGLLEQYPANYISSFHLPTEANATLNKLVRTYPNLTVIDVAALMTQVRNIMQRMSDTIEYVFAFSLISGAAVLYAALVATQQERIQEATLMRVFGASRQQVYFAYLAEFACIGLIAAIVATIIANAMAYYLSNKILDIPFQFNLTFALVTMAAAAVLIPVAAWVGFRKPLNLSPRQLLNSI